MSNISERFKDAWSVLRGVKVATGTDVMHRDVSRLGSPPDDQDANLQIASKTYEFYKYYTHLKPDRLTIYNDMDEMMEYVLASTAMDAYIEDALQEDPKSEKMVWAESPNPRVKAELTRLLEVLEIEDRAYGDMYSLGKYGDHFGLLLYNKERGVFDISPMEPRVTHRIETSQRILEGFNVGEVQAGDKKDSPKFKPWDLVHWRIKSRRPTDPYGTSFFVGSRLIYKVLKLMEEQVLIYRMNMHPDRLIFKIFTGSASPDERMRVLRQWKKALERSVALNHATGQFQAQYAPWQLDQNIYWPVGVNDTAAGVEKFPGCFTGDTRVSLLDGKEVALKDLVGLDEFWVYSFGADGRMYPGRGHSARVTKKKARLVGVALDSGEVVKCTPDHRFMLRDGTYREAQSLAPGDSLMPLYRKKDRHGYEMFQSNCQGRWVHTHRIVARGARWTEEKRQEQAARLTEYNQSTEKRKRTSELARKKVSGFGCPQAQATMKARREAGDLPSNTNMQQNWQDPVFRKQAARRASTHMRQYNAWRKAGKPGTLSEWKAKHPDNHTVVGVTWLEEREDVYDITVDVHHNFALTAGVVVHNSGNADHLFDVVHMRDLFFASVRVPKGYMGFEDSQGYRSSDTLSAQSIKFARGVKRLRRFWLQGLARVCRIHLALRGIDSRQPQNLFTLHMTPISYLEEQQRAELFAQRLDAVRSMMEIGELMADKLKINVGVWAKHVLSEYAGLDEPTVARLLTPETSDADITFQPSGNLHFESLSEDLREELKKRVEDHPKLRDWLPKLALPIEDATQTGIYLPSIQDRDIRSLDTDSLLEFNEAHHRDAVRVSKEKEGQLEAERLEKLEQELKLLAEAAKAHGC